MVEKLRSKKSGWGRAVGQQNVGNVDFGSGYSLRHATLYFHQRAYHRHAVAQHCIPHALKLDVVFDGLEFGDSRGSRYGSFAKNITQGRPRLGRADKHSAVGGKSCQEIFDIGVGAHGDIVGAEICSDFGGEFVGIDEQCRGFGGEIEEGGHHRVAIHVGAAKIEGPRYFGKVGNKHGVGAARSYFFKDTAYFG